MQPEIARLRADHARLDSRDEEFALSLINQFDRRGALSVKQWPWVTKLVAKLDAPAGATAERNLGDLTELKAMFAKAGERIKFPHLLLRVEAEPVKVWIAGPRSHAPGALSVATATDRRWVGRVETNGTWSPGHTMPADFMGSVADVLAKLIAAPQATLAEHGKQLGACCYCGTELTDARSVAAGYGQTCAKKWGLPWGKTATAKQKELV